MSRTLFIGGTDLQQKGALTYRVGIDAGGAVKPKPIAQFAAAWQQHYHHEVSDKSNPDPAGSPARGGFRPARAYHRSGTSMAGGWICTG
jgi:hypothetical protein